MLILSPAKHVGEIPERIGNIRLVKHHHLEPYQKGFLTGNWLAFHRDDYMILEGNGPFLIRWEVERWIRAGPIQPPIIAGDVKYLGEEESDASIYMPEINGWQNKYYFLNGRCMIINREEIGLYNLAVSSVASENLQLINRFNPNEWSVTSYRKPTLEELQGPFTRESVAEMWRQLMEKETWVDINCYKISEKNVDFFGKSSLGIVHDGDYVLLKGPIHVKVLTTHPVGTEAYYKIEDVEVPPEGMVFQLQEGTDLYLGDWNMLIHAEFEWLPIIGTVVGGVGIGIPTYLYTKNVPVTIGASIIGGLVGAMIGSLFSPTISQFS